MADVISVRDGVRAGFGFIRPAWRGAIGALALSAIGGGLYFYASLGGMGRGALLLALVFQFVAGVLAQGALFRIGLGQDGLGPAGLQWKALEWRLLGLAALNFLFFAVLILVLAIVLISLVLGLSMAAGAGFQPENVVEMLSALGLPGALTLILGVIAAYAFFIWVAVRLCLAAPVTAAGDRIQLLSTFDLTKGRFWRILAMLAASSGPIILVGMAGPLAGRGPGVTTGLFAVAVGLLVAFVYLPTLVGVLVYLHRRLAPSGAA